MTDGTFAVINAAQLVTVGEGMGGPRRGPEQGRLEVIKGGALVAREGRITSVGNTKDVMAHNDLTDAEVIDASGRVVMPGLVDCHTHPVFAGLRYGEYAERLAGLSREEVNRRGGGIWQSVVDTRKAGDRDLEVAVGKYFARMVRGGTTTVEAKSGYGLTLETELKHLEILRRVQGETPLRIVPTFLGAHIVPRDQPDAQSYAREIIDRMLPAVAKQGIARFCDVSCGPRTFPAEVAGPILTRAAELGLPGRVHTDGGLSCGGWSFAAAHRAVSADHLTFTPDEEIAAVGPTETIAALIPAAELYYHLSRRANARCFIENGVAVAITTDFCSSIHCAALHPLLPIAAAWYWLTPEELIAAVTVNAAYSVGMGHEVGTLEKGKRADLLVLEIPDYRMLAFEFGAGSIAEVVIDGRVVHTNAASKRHLQ
ncbi:MAG: imidazolonepropionase [Acetobacteraceae bacterium]